MFWPFPCERSPGTAAIHQWDGDYRLLQLATRGETNQSLSFAPVGARFEIKVLLSPELLSFRPSPNSTWARRRATPVFRAATASSCASHCYASIAPLTFRYTNVQVEDVYFGVFRRSPVTH